MTGPTTQRTTRRAFLAGAGGLALAALGGSRALAQVAAPASPFIVDAHCHVFSVLDLPVDGFLLAFVHGKGVPAFATAQIEALTRDLHRLLVAMAKERARLGDGGDPRHYRARIASAMHPDLIEQLFEGRDIPELVAALEIGTRARERIVAELIALYPAVSLYLPALVDYDYWTNRHRRRASEPSAVALPKQIDAHGALFRRYNLADDPRRFIHGYVPFNPLRWVKHRQGKDRCDPLFEVRRALGLDDHRGLGFVGVKVYPPNGFVPLGNERIEEFEEDDLGEQLDDAMRALFDLCIEHDIPILSHASDGNAFAPGYERRASPWGWWRALSEYPALRINLGHFGHDHGIDEAGSGIDCITWAQFIAGKLMPQFPNVYADLSYSALPGDPEYRKRYEAFLRTALLRDRKDGWTAERALRERLMFGTDWWMLQREPYHGVFLDCFRETILGYAQLWPERGLELQTGFLGRNALRFLGILDARYQLDPSNQTYRRLEKYYGARKPAWLSRANAEGTAIAFKAGTCVAPP